MGDPILHEWADCFAAIALVFEVGIVNYLYGWHNHDDHKKVHKHNDRRLEAKCSDWHNRRHYIGGKGDRSRA